MTSEKIYDAFCELDDKMHYDTRDITFGDLALIFNDSKYDEIKEAIIYNSFDNILARQYSSILSDFLDGVPYLCYAVEKEERGENDHYIDYFLKDTIILLALSLFVNEGKEFYYQGRIQKLIGKKLNMNDFIPGLQRKIKNKYIRVVLYHSKFNKKLF